MRHSHSRRRGAPKHLATALVLAVVAPILALGPAAYAVGPGQPDPTFDGDGLWERSPFEGAPGATGLSIDSEGRIVLFGASGVRPDTRQSQLMRLLPTGAPDTSFSVDGLLPFDATSGAGKLRVAAGDDGRRLGSLRHAHRDVHRHRLRLPRPALHPAAGHQPGRHLDDLVDPAQPAPRHRHRRHRRPEHRGGRFGQHRCQHDRDPAARSGRLAGHTGRHVRRRRHGVGQPRGVGARLRRCHGRGRRDRADPDRRHELRPARRGRLLRAVGPGAADRLRRPRPDVQRRRGRPHRPAVRVRRPPRPGHRLPRPDPGRRLQPPVRDHPDAGHLLALGPPPARAVPGQRHPRRQLRQRRLGAAAGPAGRPDRRLPDGHRRPARLDPGRGGRRASRGPSSGSRRTVEPTPGSPRTVSSCSTRTRPRAPTRPMPAPTGSRSATTASSPRAMPGSSPATTGRPSDSTTEVRRLWPGLSPVPRRGPRSSRAPPGPRGWSPASTWPSSRSTHRCCAPSTGAGGSRGARRDSSPHRR